MAFTTEDLERLISQIESIAGTQDPQKWTKKVGVTNKSLRQLLQEEFIETDIKVYATYNYELLQVLAGNREVDAKHVDKIVKNIRKKGYKFQIGNINEEWQVIDMQHRLGALKQIKEEDGQSLPAFVVVVPGTGRDDVVTLNSVGMTWKSKHFLQSWLNSEDPETREKYQRIQNVITDFQVPVDVIVSLIGPGHGIGQWRDSFKDGTLDFTPEKEKKLRSFLTKVQWLNTKTFGEKAKLSSRFISACKVLFGQHGFSFRDLQKRFESENPSIGELQRLNYQSQEVIFELLAAAYNYRLKGTNRIVDSWKQAGKEGKSPL